ncbi:ABC transporter ATP-binding protein [Carnobacterium mobile]|uniref:ABC transporter ATP-binding protein n=1 Tax=Carnobacterium mobile TaxID=2750 RepID=UPI0014707393|nr:ABC transporter ATP-binding protein [Carnobacterium mobile]
MNVKQIIQAQIYTLKLINKVTKGRIPFSIGLNIANGIVEFTSSVFLISYIMNSFTKNVELEKVIVVVIGIAFCKLVTNVMNSFFENVYVEQSNLKIQKNVLEMIYRRSINIDMEEFDNPKFYDTFVKVLERTSVTIFDLLKLLEESVKLLSYSIVACYFIYKINPFFILVLILPIIVGGFVSKEITNIEYLLYEKNQKEERRRSYIFRVFHMKKFESELFTTSIGNLLINKYSQSSVKIQNQLRRDGKKRWKLQYYFYLSNEVITDLITYVYTTYEVLISKRLLLGDFFLLIDSLGDVSQSLKRIVAIIIKVYGNSRYLEDFRLFLEYIPKSEKKESKVLSNINNLNFCFKNVSFRYNGNDKNSLDNINLNISKGEKIAIVGENGSGKSTLIKLLLGFYEPTKGNIYCNSQNITDLDSKSYRNIFSTIFQDFQLFPFSIYKNITLNNDNVVDINVIDILKGVGLFDKIETLKEGVQTVLYTDFDSQGVELSYGEKQRLAVARSVYQKKEIVIMDEPTSAMDPISESKLYELVKEKYWEKTVICISHRLTTTMQADKIIYLKDGSIIESGSHDELIRLNGEYAKSFKRQSENYLN